MCNSGDIFPLYKLDKKSLEEKTCKISVFSTAEIRNNIAKIHNLLYSCSLICLPSVNVLALLMQNYQRCSDQHPTYLIPHSTEICIPHSNHPIINIYSENCNSNCQKQCISTPTYALKCVPLCCISFYFIFSAIFKQLT